MVSGNVQGYLGRMWNTTSVQGRVMTTTTPPGSFSVSPTRNTNHYHKTRLVLVATEPILNVIFLQVHMLPARHGQAT